jgi:hypothetical protein
MLRQHTRHFSLHVLREWSVTADIRMVWPRLLCWRCETEQQTWKGNMFVDICGLMPLNVDKSEDMANTHHLLLAIKRTGQHKCLHWFTHTHTHTHTAMNVPMLIMVLTNYLTKNEQQANPVVWVRERTIPTERPPLLGKVIANFCR